MYRFSVAESANPNDYVGTGAAAGKGALLSQRVAARNSPDYDALTVRAVNEKAKNDLNAASVELIKRRGERSTARDSLTDKAYAARAQSLQRAEDNKRFAGKLALAAELYDKGFGEKRKRPEPYQPNFNRFEALINNTLGNTEAFDSQEQIIQQRIDSNPANMTNPSSPKTGSEQSLFPVQGDSDFQKVNYVPHGYNTLEMSPEEKALKDTIAFAEGTYKPDGGYNIMFGGKRFNNYDSHPRVSTPFWQGSSDAAGRYQFLSTTFKEQAEQLGLQDFSPYSQEVAARALIKRRNVDPNLDYSAPNMFVGMTDKLAPEWASFPYQGVSPKGFGRGSSYYGQGGKSVDELRPFYIERLNFYRHPTTPQYGGQVF